MLALVLGISANVSAGFDIGAILSGAGDLGPNDYYYTQMVATPAPSAAGQVQLTWVDMMGETMNADNISDPTEQAQYQAMYSLLNPGASGFSNPTGFGNLARLAGATILYGEIEAPFGNSETHIYVTSFAYFKAEPQANDGWYFDRWSYVDNGQIQQLDTLRSGENVLWPTTEHPNTNNAVIFKVKPHNQKGYQYLDPSAVSPESYDSIFRYVVANFKPVLLTGYTGGKSEVVAEAGNTTTITVVVSMDAKKTNISPNDFNTPVLENSTDFTLTGMTGEMVDGQPVARLTIQYTAPSGVTVGQFYKTNMTVSSKGGSTITIPLEVRAVAANRTEATLFNADKSVAKDGDLLGANGVLAAITGTDQTLQLNKSYGTALTLTGKTVTLDLNGYNVPSLTVNSGTVTVAYNKYGGEGGDLVVAGGKVILNGGTFASLTINAGTVEQNGATIAGAASNAGTLTTTEGVIHGGLTSEGTLTLNGGTFRGATAVTVSGGKATLNRATIIGSSYGLATTGGTTSIENKQVVIDGGTKAVNAASNTLTIKNGKFGNALAGSPTLVNGFFKTATIGVDIPEGKKLLNVAAGVDYTEGYRYFVGDDADAAASGVGVCRIGSTSYTKLEDAIAFANNNPALEGLVIIMTNDYVLPAGYYTLPANATIVVPMSDEQENSNSVVRRTVLEYQTPSEFRRLTFASGVKMEVFGAIEVSCTQHANDVKNHGYNSNPWGPYGLLVLEEGVKLTLQNGAHIYAWGYIIGKGEIDVRRGATIHEMFQMGDWKGGSTSFSLLSDDRGVFPVNQYYIQNVESPAKFHPGAVLTASAAVSVYSGMVVAYANDINIVGVNGVHQAMFLLDNEADADNTWVYKWYDNANDLQVYDINNTAHIGSLVLSLGKLGDMDLNMNSAAFKLPITNNMKIHLLYGFMDFTQDTYLLPGAEVEVDKEAIVSITDVQEEGVHSGSLYIYDADDWGDYIYDGSGSGNPKKFTKAVCYEPVVGGKPTIRKEFKADGQKDATILVHGQFDTNDGYLFTSEHGASIISTNEDAGTFSFKIAAKAPTYTEEVYHAKGTSVDDTPDIFLPAKLTNGDGSFTETGGTGANMSYCYMDDEWQSLFYFDCYAADVDMAAYAAQVALTGNTDPWLLGKAVKHIYIKPQEWVEIAGTAAISYDTDPYDPFLEEVVGNDDHTFSDAAGSGRLFIMVPTEEGNCQWWEVEQKDNLYHCIHPLNDTYYYWDGEWKEQRYTITWKNWDGTILKTIGPNETMVESYSVTYGTQAEYLGTNPTRVEDIDYTYNFTGWNPEPGRVTSNVTYTATYEAQPRKYTIIFQQEGGVEIERQFLTHNAIPVCENTPTKVGHILQWSPAIAAVTGDATYTATWLEEPPTEFEITFVDYDGTTVLKQDNVAVGADPVAPAIVGGIPVGSTGKPATSEFTYVFDHWSPTVTEVTEAVTYTAIYREAAKTYTIIFNDENGSEIERHEYTYGSTPVCSATPTKPNTAQYTYSFAWTPQIQTVMDNATYQAVFTPTTNKYTVAAKCNPAGAATITGSGIYEYNTSPTAVTIAVTNIAEGYDFEGWSDEQEGTNTSRSMAVTGDINLVANFSCATCDNVTITWNNWDGSLLKSVNQAKGTATTYTGATPTRPASSSCTYTFDGWTTTLNGTTVIKNGMTPKAAEGGATYYAHYAEIPVPSLEVSALQTITSPQTYQNLILTSNGITSGQLIGIENLTLTGEAYFDLTVNAKARQWYQVAVPWEVNVLDGIIVNGRIVQQSNLDVIYYDGARRAVEGPNKCWKYVAEDGNIMRPGRLYLLALSFDASVIRFKANDKAHLLNTTTSVVKYDSQTGADTDAAWNGVANPAIFHAYVNTGAIIGQVYNPDTWSYSPIVMSSTKFIVGQGVFVQAPATNDNIIVTYGGSNSASAAPRRAKAAIEDINYEVRIAPINKGYTDRLFAYMSEAKEEDVYTVGQDLEKMGVSTIAAQMWINRYDTKLCLNTMAPKEGYADYPLGISIPEAGKYTISIEYTADGNRDAEGLYLTRNGEIIWNLSQNAYTTTFEKGTTDEYGLRIRAKAPQVITGFEDAIMDSKEATATKVLINDQVFIIRGGEVYTITGNKVK